MIANLHGRLAGQRTVLQSRVQGGGRDTRGEARRLLSVSMELRVWLPGVRSLSEAAGDGGGERPQADGHAALRCAAQGVLRDKQELNNRMPPVWGQILQYRMSK